MSINVNHVGNITKDRTGKYQDRFIEKPGAEFGKELIEWLAQGAESFAEKREAILNEMSSIFQQKDDEEIPYFSEEERAEVRAYSKACPVTQEGIAKLSAKRYDLALELTARRSAIA
jgi:hypothetical protein